jgi:hypothetical protein
MRWHRPAKDSGIPAFEPRQHPRVDRLSGQQLHVRARRVLLHPQQSFLALLTRCSARERVVAFVIVAGDKLAEETAMMLHVILI